MEVKRIIYYRCNNEKREPISLRDFCLRDGFELKDIFYAVRDAVDSQELLDVLQRMCYEHIELECDEPSYIRFTVVDAYDNTNYLKLKKAKNQIHTVQNVVGIGA